MNAYRQLAFFISVFNMWWQDTYLLTSFGRVLGFSSDLIMCMALALALICLYNNWIMQKILQIKYFSFIIKIIIKRFS